MRDFSGDTALLSLNTATVQAQWTLEQCIEGCARHGIGGIAPWRDKLAECGAARAALLIREAGLRVTGLAGAACSRRRARREAGSVDDNARHRDDRPTSRMLILVSGAARRLEDIAGARMQARRMRRCSDTAARRCARHRAAAPDVSPTGLVEHAEAAPTTCRRAGRRSGMRSTLSRLVGPDRTRKSTGPGAAGAFSDSMSATGWCPRRLLLDRGMMGDGVIDIPKIRGWVEAAGYDGGSEVEIFSKDNWWRQDADDVLATCVQRHQTAV